MRGRLPLASGTDADVAGFLAELRKGGRSEVAHAGLDATFEVLEDFADWAGNFLEGFDTFGGGLEVDVFFVVAVTGGGTFGHGGTAAHAPVLFVKFPIDFHDAAGGFRTPGEEPATNNPIGKGEGFDEVTGFGEASVGDDADAFVFGGLGSDVEGCHLGDADAGDNPGRADGSWALADFDAIGTTVGQVGNAGCGGDVSGKDGKAGKLFADKADGFPDAFCMAVGGGDGDQVKVFVHHFPDMLGDGVFVEVAVRSTFGREGRSTEKAELVVPGGADEGAGFVVDAVDVTQGEETLEAVLVVDDQKLVDARVLVKKVIGDGDGIRVEFFFGDGKDVFALDHGLGHFLAAVARPDDATGQHAQEFAIGFDDREATELVTFFSNQLDDIADKKVRGDGDGILDYPVEVVFDPGDVLDLLPWGKVVVDDPQAPVESHADGHLGFGDGVHVRREDGQVEVDAVGEIGLEVGVLRENGGIISGQGDIVERQASLAVGFEECVSRLEEP